MNQKQFYFMKLAEECAEVAKIALKIAQFGEFGADGETLYNNYELLKKELNDMNGVIASLFETTNFKYIPVNAEINNKKEKMQKYLNICKELGTVK